MRRRKHKTVWAYLDGKKLVDVVQAALDNHMMVDEGAADPGEPRPRGHVQCGVRRGQTYKGKI